MGVAAAPAFGRGPGPSAAPQLLAQHTVAAAGLSCSGRRRHRAGSPQGDGGAARGSREGLRRGYHRGEERLTLVEGGGAPRHVGTGGRQADKRREHEMCGMFYW